MDRGFMIDFKTYTETSENREQIQDKTNIIPHIEIHGKFSADDDDWLFKEISKYRSSVITKLTLRGMDIKANSNEFTEFTELKELIVQASFL